jgi:Arc/MetJ family transcription regulator
MSGGGTGTWGFSPSLRDQEARRKFEQERKPEVNEISEAYFQEHQRKEAERKAREDREEQENRERLARWRADEKRLLQERLLAVMYQSNGCSEYEIARINTLVKQNNPDQYGNVDFHLLVLGKLRAVLG